MSSARQKTCTSCGETGFKRRLGLCNACYLRWVRAGRPESGPPRPNERPREKFALLTPDQRQQLEAACQCCFEIAAPTQDFGAAFDRAIRLAAYLHMRKSRATRAEAARGMGAATARSYDAVFADVWLNMRGVPCACAAPSMCSCCPDPSMGCGTYRLGLYASDRIAIQEIGCWRWTGTVNGQGYGVTKAPGIKRTSAHRYVYEQLRGEIPADLVIDHQCHNKDPNCAGGDTCLHRRCVNPHHLEVVTQGVNSTRGMGNGALNLRKESCPEGHPYEYMDGRGWRKCRTCRVEEKRLKRAGSKAPPRRYASDLCRRGHEYGPQVLRWPNGWRFCPACNPGHEHDVRCESCDAYVAVEHVCLAAQAADLARRATEFEHGSPSDLYTP